MNNKIFFSFMVFVFSPLIASELTALARISSMYPTISIGGGKDRVCNVIGIEKRSLEVPTLFDALRCEGTHRVNAQSIILAKDKNSVEITGQYSEDCKYVINFAGDSFVNLKKELEKDDKHYRFFGGFFPVFEISLIHLGNPTVLIMSESQFQEQIMGKWSLISKIMASFGIAGLAALIYYFDLHSKGMALLGRG
jgi:hypothetical protein